MTGLTGSAAHDAITLTWDDPGDDSITGYMILRRNRDADAEGHFDELMADTGSAAATYTDNTVAAETRYTYRIKAINQHGLLTVAATAPAGSTSKRRPGQRQRTPPQRRIRQQLPIRPSQRPQSRRRPPPPLQRHLITRTPSQTGLRWSHSTMLPTARTGRTIQTGSAVSRSTPGSGLQRTTTAESSN